MKIHLAATAMAFSLAAPAFAATPITYTSTQQVGSSTAALSIVTDGTLGTLTAANILSVSATLTQGTTVVTLLRDVAQGSGNAALVLTAQLQASASALVLPYIAAATNNEFGLYGPAGYQNWYAAGQGSVFSFASQNSIKVGNSVDTAALTSDLVLGTAAAATGGVPEPATWAILTLGFAGMGYVMRRRPRGARVRFA